MRSLDRLFIVDIARVWRQGLAIVALLACGVATFVMSTSSMLSLEKTRHNYYQRRQFGDVFVQLTRAPNRLTRRFKKIKGVALVEPRIMRQVILNVPGMVEPASCQMISIPVDGTGMNQVVLLHGRMPVQTGRLEAVASEQFATANNFRPGDQLNVVMGGRRENVTICGIGLSPEFIYPVQPGVLVTDNRRFGVLWAPRRQMEAAFNMEGAFNNLVLKLQPRASQEHVKFHVDRIVARYGGAGAYGREDHESHHRLQDEMQQMSRMAYITPGIFLAVSAFLCNIVLSRMIYQQKEQIATLRAFGFTQLEIGFHYLKLVLLLIAIGSALGLLAGVFLSRQLTDAYVVFFRFPVVSYQFSLPNAIFAVVVALVAAVLGSISSIRRAMRLPPAVAMRPEAPPAGAGVVSQWLPVASLLPEMMRMILRRLEANVRVTVFSVLGMSLAVAVLVLGAFMEDTIAYIIDLQFHRSQRQDVTLTFNESLSNDTVYEVAHLPGVIQVEAFRAVPVRLKHGNREHRLALMGLDPAPQLRRVLDSNEHPVTFPPEGGLTISHKLAEKLGVNEGDELLVEILEGERLKKWLTVSTVFPDYASPAAYMNRKVLDGFLPDEERITGMHLLIDRAKLAAFYEEVKETPAVAGVSDKETARITFEETVAANTFFMRLTFAVFSSIIAFGVIYNSALITLSERSREFATLRVMGFFHHEVVLLLLGEIAVIALLSIPPGLVAGYALSYVTTLAIATESHSFPLIVSNGTYTYAALAVLAATAISGFFVQRMLRRLDLLSALKAK